MRTTPRRSALAASGVVTLVRHVSRSAAAVASVVAVQVACAAVPAYAATAPARPILVSTTASAGALTLAFTPDGDGGSPITSYRAQCTSTDGGTTGSAAGVASPLRVIGLTGAKSYRCRVRATNAVGAGGYSPYGASVTLPPATLPPAPVLTSTTPLAGAVSVAFTSSGDGGSPITSYRAQCTSTDGGANHYQVGTSSPITVVYVTAQKSYQCRVRATNALGTGAHGPYGATVVIPPPDVPGRPSLGSASPGAGLVFIQLNPSSNGGSPITSWFASCRSTDGGAPAGSPLTWPFAVRMGLTAEKTYRCRVRASNALGTGPFSAYSQEVVLPPATPPQPTVVTGAAAVSPWAVKVDFLRAGDGGSPVTSYQVECSTPIGGAGVTGSVSGVGSPLTVSGLTSGVSYHCRARATNAVGTATYHDYGPSVTVP